MILAENILLAGDRLLLPKDTRLSEEDIANLRARQIREIGIVPPPAPALSADERKALCDAVRSEVQAMFRRSGDDPVNQALSKALLEYRLGKIG